MGIAYRYFGFLSFFEGEGLRFTWLQICRGWGIGLQLWNNGDDNRWTLCLYPIYGKIYLDLPFLPAREPTPYQMGDMWGFHWEWAATGNSFADAIHLNWRDKCVILHMPWTYEWQRKSVLLSDETWSHETKGMRGRTRLQRMSASARAAEESRDRMLELCAWRREYPFRYTRRSGEVQERTATIEVHELEWRMRFLQWTRRFALVRRSIDVKFSDEVGERSGSWKGGTIGCGYTLLPGETPLQCLRRMERERKF